MPDGINIDFTVSGQSALVKALEDSADASERAAVALEKQAKAAKSATSAFQSLSRSQNQSVRASGGSSTPIGAGSLSGSQYAGTSASGGSASPSRSAGLPGQNRMRYVSGPNQRRPLLNAQLAHATAAGDTDAAADIGRAIVRNEKQLAGKNTPPFEKRLDSLIRSTRIGTNGPGVGGVFPLVGQLSDVLGPELGPVGLALGAAAHAAEQFSEAVSAAAESGNKFGQLQVSTGSTAQTAAALKNLGIDAGQAAAFNSAITSDPAAMAFAAKAGVTNAPGPYGSQNTGAEILQELKYLHSMTDQDEALREANATGLGPVYSNLANLSDASFQKAVGVDADRQSAAYNKTFTQGSAEYTNADSRMDQVGANITAHITAPFIEAGARFNNNLADIVNGKMTLKHLVGIGEDKYGNVVDPKIKAQQDNTAAVKANTQQLGIAGRTYGGGERTEGAIQRGLGRGNGYALRRDLQAGAMRLGAFG